MSSNGLNTKENQIAQTATGISPADFPIGSLESRAAARAMLNERKKADELSEYDQDALTLARGSHYLCGRAHPDYQDLQGTGVYQRGWELSQEKDPIIPSHLDTEKDKRMLKHEWWWANFLCQSVHGHDPQDGDVLTFEQCLPYYIQVDDLLLERFRTAWERQLPQWEIPLKRVNGQLYRRDRKGVWDDGGDHSHYDNSARRWEGLEELALGESGAPYIRRRLRSVIFKGSDGNITVQPHERVTPQPEAAGYVWI